MGRCAPLLGGVAVAIWAMVPAAVGPARVAAVAADLQLVRQTIDVPSGGPLDITVAVPFALDPARTEDTDVVVTSYERIERRSGVQSALDGELGKAVDSVELPLATVAQPVPGQLQLSIPTEITTRKGPLLQLPKPGLYPVVVDVLVDGEVVAELTTFFLRLAEDPTSQPAPLPVALVMGTSSPTAIDDDANITVSQVALDELRAVTASVAASSTPVSVTLQPATLAALVDEEPDVAAALRAALAGDELLATPGIGFDPSSAAAAGQQDLFTRWLRSGEDTLRDAAPGISSTRAARLVDRPLSAAGATLVRDLGARVLVLTPDVVDELGATVADPSLLTPVDLDDRGTIDAAVIDPRLSAWLADPGPDLHLTSVHVVAELLAMRAEIGGRGDPVAAHSVVLGALDGGPIAPDVVAAFTATLASVPELTPAPVSIVATSTAVASTTSIRLPERAGPDITARMTTVGQLQGLATATASMLPAGDLRPLSWQYVIDALPSTDVEQVQFDALHALVEQDITAIRTSIVPPEPFRFTLAGHSSTIRLNLTNTGTAPLRVLLRLDSLKLDFPEGSDVTTVLDPGINTVRIPVETRSKGRFPVTMKILTPEHESALTDPVPLTANVNALTGLGPLVTGGALLILVSWWAHHVRGTRRRRLVGGSAARHPVAAGASTDE